MSSSKKRRELNRARRELEIERLMVKPDWASMWQTAAVMLSEREKKLLDLILNELKPACDLAMNNVVLARIPECGDFAEIAQTISYVMQEAKEISKIKLTSTQW